MSNRQTLSGYRPAAFACQISTRCVRNRPRIFVEHSAGNNDPLAQRFAGVLSRQVRIGLADVLMPVDGGR